MDNIFYVYNEKLITDSVSKKFQAERSSA